MTTSSFTMRSVTIAVLAATQTYVVSAQSVIQPGTAITLSTVTVQASADASAEGLTKPYAGGQVARGGRLGILGNQDYMASPFTVIAYTNELIQNQQARSVGDVLQNDSSVRVARGFGNFQESYFIRGFILSSDNIGYNGLFSLLPRQYISSELFERVEVLRGPSTFLNGASPDGDGIGGAINLLPKRAGNTPLTQVTLGTASGSQRYAATDLSRRFGPDRSLGIRINAAHRSGDTAIDKERVKLDVFSIGLDWRSRNARLSTDIGYQNHRLNETRTNVTVNSDTVPSTPDASSNWAQPWTYSNENDSFGTLRGELDLSAKTTAWFAAGMRNAKEANSLANLSVNNAIKGVSTTYRFDNTGKEAVKTGELGLRNKSRVDSVTHLLIGSYSYFNSKRKNAYLFDYANTQSTSLYHPTYSPQPDWSAQALGGNTLAAPGLTDNRSLNSYAISDTMGVLKDTLLITLGARRQTLNIIGYAYGSGVQTTKYDRSRTSPVAGVVYKISKSLSAYGNYIEALTPGATAPATSGGLPIVNVGEILAPYVSKQKEIGIKYDGDRIGVNAAYFNVDKPRTLRNDAGYFAAEGEDNHRGVELNVFGEAAKGLRVLGGVTWLDAKQQVTGSALTTGKRVIGVPKAQANLGIEWLVSSGFSFDGRVTTTGRSYADATNTKPVSGWTRFDVGARYITDVAGKLLTLRARIDNVANRSYWSSVGGYPDAGYLVLSAPRTFSLNAALEF